MSSELSFQIVFNTRWFTLIIFVINSMWLWRQTHGRNNEGSYPCRCIKAYIADKNTRQESSSSPNYIIKKWKKNSIKASLLLVTPVNVGSRGKTNYWMGIPISNNCKGHAMSKQAGLYRECRHVAGIWSWRVMVKIMLW